jgi:hypothetical protein
LRSSAMCQRHFLDLLAVVIFQARAWHPSERS